MHAWLASLTIWPDPLSVLQLCISVDFVSYTVAWGFMLSHILIMVMCSQLLHVLHIHSLRLAPPMSYISTSIAAQWWWWCLDQKSQVCSRPMTPSRLAIAVINWSPMSRVGLLVSRHKWNSTAYSLVSSSAKVYWKWLTAWARLCNYSHSQLLSHTVWQRWPAWPWEEWGQSRSLTSFF